MKNDDMANPGMSPGKMIDPEHYPGENNVVKPPFAWTKSISFPADTKSLTDMFGDVPITREGKPTAKLRDVLSEFGDKKFDTLDEFMSDVYGHSAQESEYQISEEEEP